MCISFQYGSLLGRSCSTQFLNIMDHFTKAFDSDYCVGRTFEKLSTLCLITFAM